MGAGRRDHALAIWLLGWGAAVVLMVPAAASAAAPAPAANPCAAGPVTWTLLPGATRLGVIDLNFFGAQGAPVTFFECVGIGRTSLAPAARRRAR